MNIECGGFTFISNFDSGNIDRVELVPQNESDDPPHDKSIPYYEFNIWTKPDCEGTEFENNNKSWFYFGVTGGTPCTDVKLNVVNLNKQGKLYKQGMAPVSKTIPGPNRWERVRERLSFDLKKNLLSFGYRTLENLCSTTYFAFTYPYSFTDLQNSFKQHDLLFKKTDLSLNSIDADDIYYHRECVIMSLEGRPVDLLTITSYHGIMTEKEPRLHDLFPDTNTPRANLFKGKKVIFLSARVHPGETPSSFVMNGVLSTLLNKTDPIAIILRKTFVFKIVAMLNPDGVSKGFYRTDTRGVNLNRLYLNPSKTLHPSVFAARALILYYHFGHEMTEEELEGFQAEDTNESQTFDVTYFSSSQPLVNNTSLDSNITSESSEFLSDAASASSPVSIADSTGCDDGDGKTESDTENLNNKVAEISMAEEVDSRSVVDQEATIDRTSTCESTASLLKLSPSPPNVRKKVLKTRRLSQNAIGENKRTGDSGLYLYVDFHGHASKKGIFMYGNHFDNVNDKVECMLLPKLLSLNNAHFHYNQCNFSRRNMYTRDRRDGLSKEGCGRVAVLKYTGLIKSYTLECNYNTGCIVNIIPPTPRPLGKHIVHPILVSPKYTPQIYEEVGRALCVSILDLIGCNPNSRLYLSQFKNICGLKESLRSEALLTKNLQSQQNIKMRQSITVMQRGSKTANKNYATNSRKCLALKRQSKGNPLSELSGQPVEKKESLLGVKNDRSNTSGTILHSLNKCGLLSNTISLIKKQSPSKLSMQKKKKILLKKKMFETYKTEKEMRQNRGEFSERNTMKRKIQKKSSPSGNASTSVRPPNKKRKKSKIL